MAIIFVDYVIVERSPITLLLVILGESGLMTALLLSRVMASMVNTLAGTVEREMNWLREQQKEPKYQTLGKCAAAGVLGAGITCPSCR